ncbi:hypothetical protein K469DRAFT_687815 [Zopfia rhizophila CBS 207.26]|uniref:Uncharacterized protein n=1 Tax=Zopfia rhizophila CBS 207.26 TaxID=1314779 RepID=A0A6A6E0K8_9PEZI|nr:hypothetical protein K469DRAFT_687815 [Zopfia rhizophila CBS 207.26]
MGRSKQCDIPFDVFREECDTINYIDNEAGVKHNFFGAKQSGLETLRKIGKTICMSGNSTLGREVLKQFGHGETCLSDSTMAIIAAMDGDERAEMCENFFDGRSTSLAKMEELQELDMSSHSNKRQRTNSIGDARDTMTPPYADVAANGNKRRQTNPNPCIVIPSIPSQAFPNAYARNYPPVNRDTIWKALNYLDRSFIQTLLLWVAEAQPRVAFDIMEGFKNKLAKDKEEAEEKRQQALREREEKLKQRGRVEPRAQTRNQNDYIHYCNARAIDLRRLLTEDSCHAGNRSNGMSEAEIASSIHKDAVTWIEEIGKRALEPYSWPLFVKRSALQALTKMGKDICDAKGTLAAGVRKSFEGNRCLEEAMSKILREMSRHERSEVCNFSDGISTFYRTVEDLWRLRCGHPIFKDLIKVLRLLKNEMDREEDEAMPIIKVEETDDQGMFDERHRNSSRGVSDDGVEILATNPDPAVASDSLEKPKDCPAPSFVTRKSPFSPIFLLRVNGT